VDRIGRYFPIALLGKGGMAEVYLCALPGPAATRKLLVLKQVRSELASDPGVVQMFLNEARLAAVLNHPNLVHTYETIFVGGSYYLVMEYVEGQSLNAILKRGEAPELSLEARIAIVIGMLAGLHYAHESHDLDGKPLGIVHRDVSPHNVVASYDGNVKLMDFGIAKNNTSSNDTATGLFRGKVAYAAPEQVLGTRLDRRTDVFAAGVVLYELASGTRFWSNATDVEIMSRLAKNGIPIASVACPQMPLALARAIEKATASERERRHATALEFATELEGFLVARNQAACARELAQFLQTKFETERRGIRVTLESQLRLISALDEGAPPESARLTSSALPRLQASDVDVVGSDAPRSASGTLGPLVQGSPPAKRYAIGLIAVALLVAGAAAIAQLPKRSPPAQREVASDPSHATAPAPPAAVPSADATVDVTLSAWPQSAQLFLDDKPLPSNPARVTARADDALHEVRATEPGYATSSRVLRFEPNQKIDLVLSPAAPATIPARAPSSLGSSRHGERPVPHSGAAPGLPSPPPHGTPTGTIDERDPYK
jgi:serine/threonine-protein kinase